MLISCKNIESLIILTSYPTTAKLVSGPVNIFASCQKIAINHFLSLPSIQRLVRRPRKSPGLFIAVPAVNGGGGREAEGLFLESGAMSVSTRVCVCVASARMAECWRIIDLQAPAPAASSAPPVLNT